jgi:hypothetical protein
MLGRNPLSTEISQLYATSAEFYRVFAENRNRMRWLSFLLLADLAKAEACFVSGLDDCVKGNYVFRDWARSWARRTIIQNAVRMMAPRANGSVVTAVPGNAVNRTFERKQEADAAIVSILGPEDFERFVFVMSVLERYSDQDCSVLLGCFLRDIRDARMRAVMHVTGRRKTHPGSRFGAATSLRSKHLKTLDDSS